MPKQPERRPNDKPQTLSAPSLRTLPPKETAGRKKKLEAPPLPQEVMDSMSELEQLHFRFFKQCITTEYPDLSPFELLQVDLMALSYISVLRMETLQLSTGELITMARTDPRTQFMRYLDSLAVRRKDRKTEKKDERSEMSQALSVLWDAS